MEMAAACASPSGAADLEPPVVLIVDDDDIVLENTCELLEGEGYTVATAKNGEDALDQLRRGLRPCLILLDLMMPGMNGWDFRQEQLKNDDLRDIPVVVMTAGGFSEASVKDQLGDIDYVPKLSSLERLLATVRRRCGEPTQ